MSPNNLDPRYGNDENSARAHQLLFNDLLRWDEQNRLAPGLALSWDTTDNQTYHIRLREGVRFHDGHELTSEDVVFTFTSMMDPAFASPWRGAFRDLASIVAIDRYSVDFILKQPSGSFLPNLVFKIVPARAGRELRQRPIGTGPYEFVSYAVDDRLEMRAFREYFEGLPRNRGIVMKIVPDDIMRGLELRKVTADLVVNDLPPDMVYQLEKEGLSLSKAPGVDYQYVGFNLRDPILKDVRVRQAIGHAIDRQAIVDHLRRGLATVADSMLPPTNWAHEPNVLVLDYDPERAKALLDEAGYPIRTAMPAAASVAVLQDHQRRISTPQAAVISRICAVASRSRCDRTSLPRCMRTLSRELPDVLAAVGRRALPIPTFFGRLPLATSTARRFQPRSFQRPGSRSDDRRGLEATDYETRRSLGRSSSCSPTLRRTSAVAPTNFALASRSSRHPPHARVTSRFCETSRGRIVLA